MAWNNEAAIVDTGGIPVMAEERIPIGVAGMLSVREVAELSGGGLPSTKKAIQQDKLVVQRVDGSVVLDARAVLAMAVYRSLDARLSRESMLRLRDALCGCEPTWPPDSVAVSDSLVVRVGAGPLDAYWKAVRYVELRDANVERRVEVLGGTPVIVGTRLNLRTMLARIRGGDTWEMLLEDYPYVPSEVMRAGVLYAETHPPAGPPIKPWRTDGDCG
jgi:uncharacterized protein (DUF433 family)